ncbi:MAG: MATE family efflux transporter [Clostridiales bacterium]|nr:MATE family efflux transporter [Clostridiales bacterium]
MGENTKADTGAQKMGEMPVHRLFLNMSIPLIISMLVQALYNVVDSVFVSMISEDALTAVSLVSPVQNLMIAVINGTAIGINALVSRRLGQHKQKETDETANVGLFLMICSYLVFLVIGLTCSRRFILMQTDIESIVEYGTTYMTIVLTLGFGLFGQGLMERLLQSTGQTIFPMMTQLTGAIINIIFDWLLVFGIGPFPKLDVAGAAYATVLGQCVAMVMAVIFNAKYNKDIHLRLRMIRPQADIIKDIYIIGIPSIIMMAIGSVMTFAMNRILIGFTSTAVAVFGAYFKMQSIVFMPIFGMNAALIPIIAYNYGAGKRKRITSAYKIGCIYACIFMWVGLAVFQLLPNQLLGLFSASDYMQEIGIPALRICSLAFICAGISVVSGSIFQATGKSIYSMIVSFIRQLIVLIPLAALLARLGDVNLVWFSVPAAELVDFTVTVILIRWLFKNLNSMMGKLA